MRVDRVAVVVAAAFVALVLAVLWRGTAAREAYDPKNFRKHGDYYCPDGYTWGYGDQQGKCCRVGTDLGARAGEDGGNCVGAVQETTSFEDAKTIVKNWCAMGSSLADVERRKPEVKALARDGDNRRELNRVCEEARGNWSAAAAKADASQFRNKPWKPCPNRILRVLRPRKIGGMCCNANKTGCLAANMFSLTDGIASLKRTGCPRDQKPSCEGGVRPVCDRPSKGERYQWFCPTDKIVYYQDADKGGDYTDEFNEPGRWYDVPKKWRNKISSIYVPRGRRIQVFQYAQGNENGGESVVIGPGTYNMSEFAFPSGSHVPGSNTCRDGFDGGSGIMKNQGCWNDSISSIKVLK